MDTDTYVLRSLELHLFFGRIMKEHALFLRAGFTPANEAFSRRAAFFQREFERLLSQALALSFGLVSRPVLESGELVTEFTALAEEQTERFTGIPINRRLTGTARRLSDCRCRRGAVPRCQVRQLNRRALELLNGLICFKETILKDVQCCRMFTMNYPLLIEHILREAKLYREYVAELEREGELSERAMRDVECFWNQIMMEHALFIRGLLDPCEEKLIQTADDFAGEYAALLDTSRCANRQAASPGSLDETIRFRDFKAAGAEGIQQCKIRSVILPLLADHVLREANHYIRLLRC